MKPEASRTGLICPITGVACEHRECKKGQLCVAERERREAAAVLQLETATAAAREERIRDELIEEEALGMAKREISARYEAKFGKKFDKGAEMLTYVSQLLLKRDVELARRFRAAARRIAEMKIAAMHDAAQLL